MILSFVMHDDRIGRVVDQPPIAIFTLPQRFLDVLRVATFDHRHDRRLGLAGPRIEQGLGRDADPHQAVPRQLEPKHVASLQFAACAGT